MWLVLAAAIIAEDCWVGSMVGWQDACCAEQPELNCFPDDHPKLLKFSVEACCPGGIRKGSGAVPRMEVVANKAVDKSDSYTLVESCTDKGVARTVLNANVMQGAYEVMMRPKRLSHKLKLFVYPEALGMGGCAARVTDAVRGWYGNATDVWSLFILEAVEFMEAMHDAIMGSEGFVDDPNDADVFYIPVNFLLLLNQVLEFKSVYWANCLVTTFEHLRSTFPSYARNAGFDHFFVAATVFPMHYHDVFEADLTNWDPFIGNSMIFAGSTAVPTSSSFAHLARESHRAMVRTRMIWAPMPLPNWRVPNCNREGWTTHSRRIKIFFRGSNTGSQVRQLVALALLQKEVVDMGQAVVIQWNTPVELRRAFRPESMGASAKGDALDADFCLILAGDHQAPSYRLSSVLQAGCIPVIMPMVGFHLPMPFTGQIDWDSISIFRPVGSVENVVEVFRYLFTLDAPEIRRRFESEAQGLFFGPCGRFAMGRHIVAAIRDRHAAFVSTYR